MNAPPRHAGALVLVPNALDLGDPQPPALASVLPQAVIQRAAQLAHWVVEDAKSARAFLKRVQTVHSLARPIQALSIVELPRPAKGPAKAAGEAASAAASQAWMDLLEPAQAGDDIGLLSEAGLPAVADPGSALVRAAHDAGIQVEVLPGPSALLLALAASGLDGNAFAFHGYLPAREPERSAAIRRLEQASRRDACTQICIETPYRNASLLAALVETLGAQTRLAVSCGLTQVGGFSRSASITQWRRAPIGLPDHLPAVFSFRA